jgi:uncharacterized membrane protein YkoI
LTQTAAGGNPRTMQPLLRLLAFALTLAAPSFAEDDGKLTIAIPSSVQATIAREKGDTGNVHGFRKVNESDGTTYIVAIAVNGKTWELSLDASGRVMRKRLDTGDGAPKLMRVEALPAHVRETMQREAGAGVIGDIELVEQKTKYVAEAKHGTRRYRIEVDADGVLLNKEFLGDEE